MSIGLSGRHVSTWSIYFSSIYVKMKISNVTWICFFTRCRPLLLVSLFLSNNMKIDSAYKTYRVLSAEGNRSFFNPNDAEHWDFLIILRLLIKMLTNSKNAKVSEPTIDDLDWIRQIEVPDQIKEYVIRLKEAVVKYSILKKKYF